MSSKARTMSEPLHYDEIAVGQCWVSRGRTITETDVVNFATLTGDFDPLHMDAEFASGTPFRQRIAHGLLGLTLAAGLASQCPPIRTDAFVQVDQWQFHKPIFFGDTIRVETTITNMQQTGRRRGTVIWHRALKNQRDETVQEGQFETIVAMSVAGIKNQRKAA